jgi:GNAT superfamily N-acetyltransferase
VLDSLSKLRLREAQPSDVPALHALLAEALPHDRFSPELLQEKLFSNPRPETDLFRTVIAEESGRAAGLMQSVTRPSAGRAWLGLFATRPSWRHCGLARMLFAELAPRWRTAGVTTAEALAMPGNYFTPGLDPRYTAALCFLERCGFERFGDCSNLTSDITGNLATEDEERRLRDVGVEVRRASPIDRPLLDAFFAAHFGPDWRLEAELSLNNDPPALHQALRGGQVIAFAAHSTQNREWGFFGPMGTAPDARGLGVGRVLLLRCLHDLQRAGHRTAVIPWVGPISIYARCVPTVVERVFWRYRQAL